MILGLRQGEIRLVTHQQSWSAEFNCIRNRICDATGITIERIEHIGSTSIKDLKAKPIIDFVVGVDDISNVSPDLFKTLQNINFYRLRVKLENEIVIARFEDKTFDVKTHIIHLVDYNRKKWNDLILFRDRLNASEALWKEYEEIKMSFIQTETGDMNDYTHFKEAFVIKVLES